MKSIIDPEKRGVWTHSGFLANKGGGAWIYINELKEESGLTLAFRTVRADNLQVLLWLLLWKLVWSQIFQRCLWVSQSLCPQLLSACESDQAAGWGRWALPAVRHKHLQLNPLFPILTSSVRINKNKGTGATKVLTFVFINHSPCAVVQSLVSYPMWSPVPC